MKKCFLSLATIAFVATSALTVTSCGSDDSTTPVNPDPNPDDNPGGEDDNPGEDDTPGSAAGTLTYNGTEFNLDNVRSQIYGHRNENDALVPTGFRLPINQGQDTIMTTRWNIIAYNGEDALESDVYYQLSFFIEVDSNNNIVRPGDADSFYLAGGGQGIVLYAGDADNSVDLGQMSTWGLQVNTFTEGQNAQGGTIDYLTSYTAANGTVESEYDGELIGTHFYVPPSPKGGVNEIGRFIGTDEKVDFNKVRLSDKAVLATAAE